MFFLIPKSYATMCFPFIESGRPLSTHRLPGSGAHGYSFGQEISLTMSRPSRPGQARAISTSFAGSVPLVESAAFCVPPSRSLRVSQRVSTPLIPGTPASASQSGSGCSARQFETTGLTARTTAAEICGRPDS